MPEQSNIMVGILMVAIILCVSLLGIVIVLSVLSDTATEEVTIITNYNNQTGWLNSTGYPLLGENPSVSEVRVIDNGYVIDPSNYTILNNKVYNTTTLTCS